MSEQGKWKAQAEADQSISTLKHKEVMGSTSKNHEHILSSCEVALKQGHLRRQRNRVLQKLAEHLEKCRIATNTFSDDKTPGVPFPEAKQDHC